MSVSLWARNITNKEYDARGFGTFGNNPENGWIVEDYRQLATPRTFGVTLSYDF
jgi:outer membrane receptor protein involved in Fe transport